MGLPEVNIAPSVPAEAEARCWWPEVPGNTCAGARSPRRLRVGSCRASARGLRAKNAVAREEMATKPPRHGPHKRLVRGSPETPLDEGLALERTLFLDLMTTDDAHRLMAKMNDEDLDIRRV